MSRLKQEDEGRHTEIKSGLTEENGPPISAPNPCASSDSTQDSGKRRKLTTVDAGNNNRAGFVFRIKLPQKKHIDVTPPAIDERPCSSGQIEKSKALPKPKNLDSLAANKQTLLDRRLDQPRVEKSQSLLTPKKPDSLATNKQTLLTDRRLDPPGVEKPQTLPKPKNADSLAAHKRTLLTDRFSDQPRVEKPQTLPKPKNLNSLAARKQTLLTDRPLDQTRVEKPRTLPKPKNPDSLLANERTLLTVRPLDQPLLLKHRTPDPEPPATTREQPCTSGRALQPEAAAEADRKKRSKIRSRGDERENRYRELVLNWLPPLQLENQDDEDQDWLFGTKPKTGDFITKRCVEALDHGGDVSKARYLPELDMVMLPYVVPY